MIPVVRQPEEERGNLTLGAGRHGCCSSYKHAGAHVETHVKTGHRIFSPQMGGGPRLSASDKGEALKCGEEAAGKAVRNTAAV